MKSRGLLASAVAVALMVVSSAWAGPDGAKGRPGGGRGGPGGSGRDGMRGRVRGQIRERIMGKVDADGDGQISDAERAAAREAMIARLKESGRWDEIVKKFDADKDGKLSETEHAAAREAFQQRLRDGAGPGGKGGPGEGKGGPGPGGPGRGKGMLQMRGKILEKFDADKDGKLSETERAAAREAFQQRRQEGADGKGDGKGRPGARRPGLHAKILERFDTDKDGKLSETERAAAREAFQQRRQERGEGAPAGGAHRRGSGGGRGRGGRGSGGTD